MIRTITTLALFAITANAIQLTTSNLVRKLEADQIISISNPGTQYAVRQVQAYDQFGYPIKLSAAKQSGTVENGEESYDAENAINWSDGDCADDDNDQLFAMPLPEEGVWQCSVQFDQYIAKVVIYGRTDTDNLDLLNRLQNAQLSVNGDVWGTIGQKGYGPWMIRNPNPPPESAATQNSLVYCGTEEDDSCTCSEKPVFICDHKHCKSVDTDEAKCSPDEFDFEPYRDGASLACYCAAGADPVPDPSPPKIQDMDHEHTKYCCDNTEKCRCNGRVFYCTDEACARPKMGNQMCNNKNFPNKFGKGPKHCFCESVEAPKPEMKYCGNDGSMCSCSNEISYCTAGKGGVCSDVVLTSETPIKCSADVFSDPAEGKKKYCFCSTEPKIPETDKIQKEYAEFCAVGGKQGGRCKCKGRSFHCSIHKCSEPKWGNVKCTNKNMGDPDKGKAKNCFCERIPGPEDSSFCANVGDQCRCGGEVRLCTAGKHGVCSEEQSVRRSIKCDIATFGDPAVDEKKYCFCTRD